MSWSESEERSGLVGRMFDLESKVHEFETHRSHRVVPLGKPLNPLLSTGSTPQDRHETSRHD